MSHWQSLLIAVMDRNSENNMSENIGRQLSVIADNMLWDEQSRSLYTRMPPPFMDGYDTQIAWEFPLVRALSDRVRVRAESLRRLRETR